MECRVRIHQLSLRQWPKVGGADGHECCPCLGRALGPVGPKEVFLIERCSRRAIGWKAGAKHGLDNPEEYLNGTMMKVPVWCAESPAQVISRTVIVWTLRKTTRQTMQRARSCVHDQKIEAHGKKIVDVLFYGQTNEAPVPGSIKVDVSGVARNVASMGRVLRAG